jgi:hypothetical protein
MLPGTHFLWRRAVLLSHFPESPRVQKNPNFLNSAPTSTEGAQFKKFSLFLNTGVFAIGSNIAASHTIAHM